MRAHDSYLTTLLNQTNSIFNIPVYQRNYDWDTVNCRQLFNDIEVIALTGKDHFIGSIVYVSVGTASIPEFNIIDGQQRITSVLLLMKALYDSTDNETLKKVIKYTYLVNKDLDNLIKIKLKQVESDSGVFEKIIMLDEISDNAFTEEEKGSNVYKNYRSFVKNIEQSSVDIEDLYNAIFKLAIIDVRLTTEDPQEVFESMNSTGKSLTNTDLLRNYLLMNLSNELQTRLYKQYWLQIEKMIGPSAMEPFMVNYLIIKRKSDTISLRKKTSKINKISLYESYKNYYSATAKSDKATEELLKDMLKYAPYYKRLFKRTDINNELDKSFYELIYELNGDPASVFIMYLMESGRTDAELLEATKACISYTFRQRCLSRGNAISNQFFSSTIQNYEKCDSKFSFIEKVWNALLSGKGRYSCPTDAMFEETFRTKNMYLELKLPLVRYILYKFETALTKEIVKEDDVTIEHILPQNTTKWQKYLLNIRDSEYNEYMNKIGNLTLTKYNSELSNEPFDKKKEFYKDSGYKITRDLASNTEWNSATIKERCASMAKEALILWPVPEDKSKTDDAAQSYYMNDDVAELLDELRSSIKEFYPFTKENLLKVNINILKDDKIVGSIVPRYSLLYMVFNTDIEQFDSKENLEDISQIGHWGVGNTRMKISSEDDIWTALDNIQHMIDKKLV